MRSSALLILCAVALIAAGLFTAGRMPSQGPRKSAEAQSPSSSHAQAKTPSSPTKREPASVLLKKLLEGGDVPKLTPVELKAYVEKCNHSAASLLAAWQLGSDPAWLEEAVQRYPDDPKVALAKLSTLKELNGDAKEWIECLKKNDPENALGWCYDAMSALKGGNMEEAREALASAAQRGRFGASWMEEGKSLSAAYESAGYDGFVSELVGTFSVRLPQAQLAMSLSKEAISQMGTHLDDAAIQDLMAVAHSVRGEVTNTPLIMNLVGASMEKRTLDQLSALELVPGTRKLVIERMDELEHERHTVQEAVSKSAPLLAKLNESELKQYFRRFMVEGELKAMQWLISQHPELQ